MELALNQRMTPFDLENTLECGQLFRWEKIDDWWYGVAEGAVVKVQQKDGVLNFEGVDLSFIREYFRLEDDLPFIISAISRDALMKQAVQASPGLRLVRQNPWECLISYVCATYKNIPAIKNMVRRLSKRFGQKLAYENRSFYAFPEPRILAGASLDELRSCGLGYRAKFVREVANMAASKDIDFARLKEAPYGAARTTLQRLPGVGNKVADCVLLFALDKLEAFPVDVWMKRVILKHYAEYFQDCFVNRACEKTSLSQREYDTLSSFARDYFGEYAGYAQEYLFYFIRCKMGLEG
jgi:N-glycosylase/DNA lyase